jgi:hypothetical protein
VSLFGLPLMLWMFVWVCAKCVCVCGGGGHEGVIACACTHNKCVRAEQGLLLILTSPCSRRSWSGCVFLVLQLCQ